jgi:hypothetical protein
MAVNRKATKSLKHRKDLKAHAEVAKSSHANFMGGRSYKVGDPINLLRTAAASCFFGEPQYYRDKVRPRVTGGERVGTMYGGRHDYLTKTLGGEGRKEWAGKTPTQIMELSIDQALDHDVEATLQLAVELRNEHNIRLTPQVILVRAANHPKARGTGLVRKYAKQIATRADEPANQLAYQIWRFGRKKIPNSLKRAWKDILESFDEYGLAKYRSEGREVKAVDVINLAHPKSDACSKLVKGELKNTGATWEAITSAEGSTKSAWEKAIPEMGHMALLRNLRNLKQAGVNTDKYLPKLIATAPKGRQLPFRYFSAYKMLEKEGVSARVLDAVEECLEVAIMENVPHFNGRVMSLSDNSGSAWGTVTSPAGTMHVAEIDNLTAVLTAKASDEGYIGIFGDRLNSYPIRKKSSVFDELQKANRKGQEIGGSTENGIWLFWDTAIREKEHWDHVFVYSDMQAGHGGLFGTDPREYSKYAWDNGYGRHIDVPKLILDYRNKVNPNVMVYLVQTAGYTDTIVPEFYDKTYILGGWSDAILKFAGEMNRMQQAPQQIPAK